MDEFVDKTLKCKDCGQDFIWTAGEQRYFAKKGLRNKPARCKDCRLQNRQKLESEFFKVTCAKCQLSGEVLFTPKDPSAQMLCKNCFNELYGSES